MSTLSLSRDNATRVALSHESALLFHEMVDIPRAAPTRPMTMEKGGKDPPRNAFEQRAETPPAKRQGRS